MDQSPAGSGTRRGTLSRERILEGALRLADEIGIEAFTMRRLAAALDVKPMTIYHHVPGKEQIIDGLIDLVFAEIDLPSEDEPWVSAMRTRCRSLRAVLHRHPWATPLMESRTFPGPALLRHHDAVLACLRRGGLSWATTAHAYAILDSFVYGFALEESALPVTADADLTALADQIMSAFPEGAYPHLVDFTVGHVLQPGYSYAASFDIGLDLILSGIERLSAQSPE